MNAPDRLVTHLISSFFFLSSLGLSFAKLNGNGNGNGNMALPCSVPPEAGGWLWHTYIHTYLLLAGRLQMAATPFDTLPNNHGIASKFQFQVHLLGGESPTAATMGISQVAAYLHTYILALLLWHNHAILQHRLFLSNIRDSCNCTQSSEEKSSSLQQQDGEPETR